MRSVPGLEWETIDDDTSAFEVTGVGVVLAREGFGMIFVPGARVKNGDVVREDRSAPLNKRFKPPSADDVAASNEGIDDDESID